MTINIITGLCCVVYVFVIMKTKLLLVVISPRFNQKHTDDFEYF